MDIMRFKERLLRNFMLIVGISLMSIGIVLSIKGGLGTTSISCIPYVLSLYFPFTVGQITIIFNLLLVLFQMVLLREFKISLFYQMIICFIFGYIIDFFLWILTFLNPTTYIFQFLTSLMGCFILALGILIEVKSDITMLPGDGAVYTLYNILDYDFGKIKICFDSILVITGAVLSIILLRQLIGVREGTIMAAILVGPVMDVYEKLFGYKISNFLKKL